MKNLFQHLSLLFLISFSCSACDSLKSEIIPNVIQTPNISIQSTKLPFPPKKTINKINTATPNATETVDNVIHNLDKYALISPLDLINKEDLREIISNPFQEPTTGQDDGHHGVDFAFYSYKVFDSIDNHSVVAILPGKVSAVIIDRPPYGNAIIIETSLELLSDNIITIIDRQNLDNEIYATSNLHCPPLSNLQLQLADTNDSLYVLYGHLKFAPVFEINDVIEQGQGIDYVGNTGFSGNPHLHLETRIGPAHATFPEMAHYHNSASANEMAYYCLWRVSNYFSPIDPTIIIFE